MDKRTNPQTVLQHSLGILLIFYTGKAPGRLFVAFMVTIKPFDNEVANHTAHDSNEKRDYNFHSDTSSLLRVLVGNTKIITYYLIFFYLFHQKGFDNMNTQSDACGIPYQTLINLYLSDCAKQKKHLQMSWK
ncbi:hypothetical protein AALC25_03330 [Lachnospiraceae bacterium 29-84]